MAEFNTTGADFLLGKFTPGMPSYRPPSVRTLGISAGDEGAILDQGQRQAKSVAGGVPKASTPYSEMMFKLTDMLKQYQTLGTRPFAEQELNARESQANRVLQETPSDLIGASPQIQSRTRANFAGALDPTIAGAREGMQTFGEQIKSFGSTVENIQNMLKEERDNMRQNIIDAATLGGSAGLESLAKTPEGKEAFKVAGFDAETLIASVRAKEREEARRFNIKEGTPSDPNKTTNTLAQLSFLKDTVERAKNLAGASGRSGARRSAESFFVGATDYTNLEAATNTLRTNVLTLMTDPDVKKFFGPQMSEADVRLMTAAGTTLNPELQSPENLKLELGRLENLLTRMDGAVRGGSSQVVANPQAQTKVVNGVTYVKQADGLWHRQ